MLNTAKNRAGYCWARYVFLSFLLLAVAGGAAHGGVHDSMFALGVHGSGYYTGDADNSPWYGGAHAKLRLTAGLMLEGAIDYRSQEFLGGTVKVDGYPVQASLLWYIFKGGVIGKAGPHLIFGGTWYNATTSLGNWETTSSEFGYHGGFGADVGLGDHFSISGDVRYQFLDIDTNEYKISHDGYITSIGMTFWF